MREIPGVSHLLYRETRSIFIAIVELVAEDSTDHQGKNLEVEVINHLLLKTTYHSSNGDDHH